MCGLRWLLLYILFLEVCYRNIWYAELLCGLFVFRCETDVVAQYFVYWQLYVKTAKLHFWKCNNVIVVPFVLKDKYFSKFMWIKHQNLDCLLGAQVIVTSNGPLYTWNIEVAILIIHNLQRIRIVPTSLVRPCI